jgi:hypothetical protein
MEQENEKKNLTLFAVVLTPPQPLLVNIHHLQPHREKKDCKSKKFSYFSSVNWREERGRGREQSETTAKRMGLLYFFLVTLSRGTA